MKRFFTTIFWLLIIAALAFWAVRFGPSLYARIFSGENTNWISERFQEELKEKNELVVFEATITGREIATQNAWLLGTVQEVSMPYSYSISYLVDLSQSTVSAEGSLIRVQLPAPRAGYSKLTVDEANMQKNDWLYRLTPERYAAIKEELEAKLFAETALKQEYLEAAWNAAVKSMESLFQSVANQSAMGATCEIRVEMASFAPPSMPDAFAAPDPYSTPEIFTAPDGFATLDPFPTATPFQ